MMIVYPELVDKVIHMMMRLFSIAVVLKDNFMIEAFYFIFQILLLPSVVGFYLAHFFTKQNPSSYFAFVVLGILMVT